MNENKILSLTMLILFLAIEIAALTLIQTTEATVIFQEGFESGDFSAWSSQRTNNGGTISVVSTLAHHGTYSCKASFQALWSEGWTRKTFTAQSSVYGRWYVYVSRLPDSDGDGYGLGGFGGTSDYCGYLYIFRVSGAYVWRLRYFDFWTDNWQDLSGVDSPQANTWFCVEIYSKAGAGTAEYKAYVNGVQGCSISGKYQPYSLTWFEVGGIQEAGRSNATVNIYSDCIVVADTYIGPEEVPTKPVIYKISIDSTKHNDYGLGYPVTYAFAIPSGSSNLKAYKRYSQSENWVQLTEKTSDDFFNGIECVRFDYASKVAYVSVAFSATSDNIYIKITDQNDNLIPVAFVEIPRYYDNRKAVVVASADDWDGNTDRHNAFMAACNAFQSRNVWLTVGITTVGMDGTYSPNWEDIQSQLDEGYIEAASHSRTHPHTPYSDYDSEIGGSKNDIIGNLTLPSLYRKGTSEYVWAWIEPYGESDSTVRQKLSQNKYLIARTTIEGQNSFAPWNSIEGLFERYGTSIKADGKTAAQLNAEFDARYSAGEIYHFWFHPYSFNWSGSNAITEHLDYIRNKTDVWYVGFGALYSYYFVENAYTVETMEEPVTIGEFQAPSMVYANKYFFLNATIQNPNGVTNFANATIEISNGIILKWDNATNTFSKLQDTQGYCTLDSSNSFRTTINSTAYRLSWKIKLNWNYPEGPVSIFPTNTNVFDKQGASGGGSYNELFTFEDDLIVYSASVDDSRINPLQSITFTGTLYYEGTTTPPEDTSGITAKVNLGGTLKGLTTAINSDGTFSISIDGEQNVAQYSYTIYATTDENTVQNQTVSVIVDRIQVQDYIVSDERVNINDSVQIDVLLQYEYDRSPVTDGLVAINGISAVHQGDGVWRITQNKSTVQAVTYNTVSASENIYGITAVNQNGKSVTVIWDRIKVASLTASKNRIDVGSPTTIFVHLIYEYDNATVSSGSFTLNGLILTYKNGAWVASDVGNYVSAFTYDNVEGADGNYGITIINMRGQSTTVIWDRVAVTLSISDDRIDIGATADITYTAIYEFDFTSFTGTLTLNDTTIKNTVGKYGYKVASIYDPIYGLTTFTTNEVYCIFDRVNIFKFEAVDNRINVGDSANFIVEGIYEYDSTPWVGSFELNDTATKTTVGKYWYKIVRITDSNYDLTIFQQTAPNTYVIFDRINVVSYGSDDQRRDVNTDATFYLTLEYEYDGTPVTDGIAYLNGSLQLTWSNANSRWEYKTTLDMVKKLTVYLVEVGENTYGITALNPSVSSKTITVIWDQIKITEGGTTKETLTLDETVIIWFKAIYEYDSEPFTGNNGTLYLNGTQMSWSPTNMRWEYTYTADTIGTITFKISAVFDISQNLTTINDSAGTKTISVWSMPFSITSNSIITELYFNSTGKIITFKVSGQSGTLGYINITLAKTLIGDISELRIYLDDEPVNYTLASTNNFWLIHFTYTHSTHKVLITLDSTDNFSNTLHSHWITIALSSIIILTIASILLIHRKFNARKSYGLVRKNNSYQ